ncbi:MAG: cell envelope integrity protein CreD [Kangiellaceae bacterium]|nr:cell envelope integrity protein CreD [Kangiellaceae bacterium]MCW9018165.1 cell envelope integrity protein CreD [Kangiellaceae bacterium]
MKTLLLNKYLWLVAIVFALNIPLLMIESQIEERSGQRDVAKQAVTNSWTGEQSVLAKVLIIPYQQKEKIIVTGDNTYNAVSSSQAERYKWVNKRLYLFPEQLNVQTELDTQTLSKGIYEVPVYTADMTIKGNFDLMPWQELRNKDDIKQGGGAYLSTGIKDSRGLNGIPQILVNQQEAEVKPGTQFSHFASGFHAYVDSKSLELDNLLFLTKLNFKGTESIEFVLTGKENSARINSSWPHPNFNGAFLPTKREINNSGYSAQWHTGIISTNIENKFERCVFGDCDSLFRTSFGVKNIQSIDIYLQSLRSVKYGLLIVIVTFAIFALYEIINRNISVHPISYVLTGCALAIFFLLLIALSEHLYFGVAYWVSALSCASLISYYISHQSRSNKIAFIFMALLSFLYLILFFIIRSEDHALLSGSLLVFFVLAIVMFVTRKLDWYKVMDNATENERKYSTS